MTVSPLSPLSYPPLEGEGRLTLSAAKCETGWGDSLSTRALFEARDCHPTPPRVTRASTLPLQGRVSKPSLNRHSLFIMIRPNLLSKQAKQRRSPLCTIEFKFQTARRYAFAFSRRDAPEVCINFTLARKRGRRESRAPIAPAVVRTKSARVDHRSTGSLRLSLREWFTAYFALSPVTGLFATVALQIDDTNRTRLGRMHLRQT